MRSWLKLIRIHQYIKNGFLFLPVFFALRFTEWDLVLQTFLAAACFSLVASSIYILNDILDVKEDRNHPTKKDRPIASGAISKTTALIGMGLLLLTGLGGMAMLSLNSLYFTLVYFFMNIGYSLGLKHIPILDICMISIGFVLRLFVGAYVGEIPLSKWIILMTFLLALFLALAKRRDDVLLAMKGKEVRKSINGYNLQFINGGMMIMASVTIVAYISYCVSPSIIEKFNTEDLYLTVVFVILGILRYMQLTFVQEKSGSPSKVLLKDLFLQITIVAWVISFILLIYVSVS